jgi:methylisocitrate lyase
MSQRTSNSASRLALPACPSRTALDAAIVRCMRRKLAIERIRAARAAIDASKSGVVLTGRCEAWLVGDPDPLHTALDRLTAYSEAGADCLYAPAVSDPNEIAQIINASLQNRSTSLFPDSIIILHFQLSPISACAASRSVPDSLWLHGGFPSGGARDHTAGTFKLLANSAPSAELNELFRQT